MTSPSQVQSFKMTLGELQDGASTDLANIFDGLGGVKTPEAVEALHEVVPEAFDPYASVISDISSQYYDELRSDSKLRTLYRAQPLDQPVDPRRWHSLIGFGTNSKPLEQATVDEMFTAITGGMSRIFTEVSGSTINVNAARDPESMAVQRVPSPGCCAFCAMLASLGMNYSGDSANTVVGRGVPISSTLGKPGGQGRGVKARGNQPLGDEFHDHCKCALVPVFKGNKVHMEDTAAIYYSSYRDSADKVNGEMVRVTKSRTLPSGRIKNKYLLVHEPTGTVTTPEIRTKMILAQMRKDYGMK